MYYYHWLFLASTGIFIFVFFYHLLRTIILLSPADFSRPSDNAKNAAVYAFTKSMSPGKKESAYQHLPTYATGMVFHLGTFFSFGLLIMVFFNVTMSSWASHASTLCIAISIICGFAIFLKRVFNDALRSLSLPDDYFSNLLVCGFQFITALTIYNGTSHGLVFIYASFMMLYIPLGKLKHTIYFFASRIYLSRFYGKRGVWPVKHRIS